MQNDSQNKYTLTQLERRLLMIFIPIALFVLYQLHSPVSFAATGDIYQEPEATITILLLYVTVFAGVISIPALARERRTIGGIIGFCLIAPTLYYYIAIAMVIFGRG